ncbi:hypothetical protein B5X24_HaOG202747 [Helicoverpa armigera]|uniref:Uncharacterized protein n=1 Tax=Helicoverpa armigera TaxID=29058 RepID=A0A2W1BYP1_HELAM|nr:hypothetical protein B5X24_HaOG202747 [Helicoverpa armigera]
MKFLVCFILLINISYCYKYGYDSFGRRRNYGMYRVHEENGEQPRQDYNASIIRPCYPHDIKCIRRLFHYKAQCTRPMGYAPDPYMLRRLDLRIPHANITFGLLNAQVRGLNEWKIKEFFFNKATDVLVLEVEFDRIVVSSTRVKIIYHRRGEEPLQVSDYSIIEYCGVSLTLTIPHIQYLQLSGAHVFSYISEATPRYTLGPAIYKVKDRGFRRALKEMVTSLGLSIQEVFVNQGSVIMSAFLQSIICDFRHH